MELFKHYPLLLKRLQELAVDKTLEYLKTRPGSDSTGAGFNWDETEEGDAFWHTVLMERDIEAALEELTPELRKKFIDPLLVLKSLGYTEKESINILKSCS